MSGHIATVSSKGQFVIPANIREALNILPGTRVAVTQDGDRVILQPIAEKFVKETRGITAGHGSMTEMLLKERRKEDQRSKW